jgi:hypothetical protein
MSMYRIELDPAQRDWKRDDVAKLPIVRRGEYPTWDQPK